MTGLSYNLAPPEDDLSSPVKDTCELHEAKKKGLHLLEEPELEEEEENPSVSPASASDPRELIAALYTELRPQLYRYLCGTLNIDVEQAKEIIQEAFLRVTIQLMDGKRIRNPQGWVVRVARNLAVDLHRKQNQRLGDADEVEAALAIDRADLSLNQEESLLEDEQMLCMEKALLSMNPRHRHCFLMRAQGLHYRDIGEAMNISAPRVVEIVDKVIARLAVICG